MSNPTFKRIQALRTALASAYGEMPAISDTDAILFKTAKADPKFEMLARGLVKGHMGADEMIPVGERFDLIVELELQASGTQGVPPALGEYLLCSGHAETIVPAGSAGLTQTSPATSVGTPVGAWTYTKTAAPVVTLPRVVTLTCTTAGGSGVAAFTVAAPAVGAHAAHNATGVVMTDATPFALCNSATITPTVTAPFSLGDSFTLKLMPPHVYYSPVSDAFADNGGLMHFDKRNFEFMGARYTADFSLTTQTSPSIKFTGMGLYGGISEQLDVPATTLTRWKKPCAVNAANTTAATLYGVVAPMTEFTFNAGCKVFDDNKPGSHRIELTDRAADSCAITIESPAYADWNYHEAIRQVLLGGLSWQHGTVPGYIVAFESAVAQVSEPEMVDVNGKNHVKFKVGLIPYGAGNNEYKILFY